MATTTPFFENAESETYPLSFSGLEKPLLAAALFLRDRRAAFSSFTFFGFGTCSTDKCLACTRCVQPKTATRCKIAGHDDWTCGKLIVTYSLSSDLCGVATLTCFPDFGKASFAAVGVENDEFTVPAGYVSQGLPERKPHIS